MSDENKNFGDKADDSFDKTNESAKEFSEGAKKTANEFTSGAKEAFGGTGAENKKMLAGILAIVLGGFGIHKFILGYTKEGIILLVVTLVLGVITCGLAGWVAWIVGIVEGIIYLTKTDEEFYATYQVGRKPWF